MNSDEKRPDPDLLLKSVSRDEKSGKGKLKIFLGYAAGVGKTYAMLDEAHDLLKSGEDVVVGYVEPHTRPETLQLLEGLPSLPPLKVEYKGIRVNEFDLTAALARRPGFLLVDELAHTNAEGVRNKKRYQDIEELLNAGINVYTTVNIQHIESLNDIVEDITKISVRETIPDYIFDHAELVKVIDIAPEELLRRFEEGKIYRPERATAAMSNFFKKENLQLLREVALRKAAERVGNENFNSYEKTDTSVSQRFLVCIGPSPSSAKCIRWTARAADAFHAPWTVLYVETEDQQHFSTEQRQNIQNHFELAAKLGAKVVTLSGYDIADSVAEYARLSGITNIVIGKSRTPKSLKSFYDTALEDRLIAKLGNTEIYIIPDNDHSIPYQRHKQFQRQLRFHFSLKDIVKSIGFLTAATVLSWLLRELRIGDQNIIMVYILAVLIISRFTEGYAYSLIFSILSVLIFNFLFVPPYFTFTAIQSGYPVTFIIMFLAALLTSAMMTKIKDQAKRAVARERKTEVLHELNKELLVTRGLSEIIKLTNEYVSTLYDRSVIFYPGDPEQGAQGELREASADRDAGFLLSPEEQAVAHWVFINKKQAGAGTDTLMGANAFYLPVISQVGTIAVLGLSCVAKEQLYHDQKVFLGMIASLVAMALERQRLSDEQEQIKIDSEKESMRSNLLRAISHDLRTPLTAISGASAAILENKSTMDAKTHDKLLSDIQKDAQWLIRMVENLLSVTRINEGAMDVVKTPQAVEEVASEAVTRVRGKFPGAHIAVKVPAELLLVPMDATLIEQVIINLLDNAIKHSESGALIELTVKKMGEHAVFEVSDNGEGIPGEDLPALFAGDTFNKNRNADGGRGMGIGLSICQSIIKAHHGEIEAENKAGGGALFRFMLPLKGGNQDDTEALDSNCRG